MAYADALKRAQRAMAMRAFYEPGWFGAPGPVAYTDPLGFSREAGRDQLPPTMGGFAYARPSDAPAPLANQPNMPAMPPEVLAELERKRRATATRRAYSAPPVGQANLTNYGVGQLQNYGVGALGAYQPLESLRRR